MVLDATSASRRTLIIPINLVLLYPVHSHVNDHVSQALYQVKQEGWVD